MGDKKLIKDKVYRPISFRRGRWSARYNKKPPAYTGGFYFS
jgi:hypothetical protein